RIPGPERIELVEIEQLLVRFDRGQPHPVEREQQNEHDDRQRQIKRDEAARHRLQIAHTLAVIIHRGRRRRARQHGFDIDGPGGQISHSTLPAATAAARAGLAPFAPKNLTQRRAAQSLDSPCCHLRRCSPNQEIMIAASRNGIIALEIAAPSPSCPAMIARWYDNVAIRWVALTGPPRVMAQINWKSVKVNSTENVITTAMIGVSSG